MPYTPQPKPAKPINPRYGQDNDDEWERKDVFGSKSTRWVPHGENPICCEPKPQALQPLDRFKPHWKPGDLECEKAKGGCGSIWRKRDEKQSSPDA